jgi:O-antigen ligase
MAALLVVTLALAFATGDRRVRTMVALLALTAGLGACGFVAVKVIGGESLNQVTSDRTDRVEDTVRVIEQHPLVGVGIGGQPRASRELAGSDRPTPTFVSHTTPLTVAAELGAVGLVLYAWLLVGGVRLIVAVRRAHDALGLALGAAFLALFVHALSYSGFLEDPLTWLVLGVAAGYLTWPREPSGGELLDRRPGAVAGDGRASPRRPARAGGGLSR